MIEEGAIVALNPGTLIGPRTWVYPGAVLRGPYPGNSVVKVEQKLEAVLLEAVLLVVVSRR
jgi:hypothetical protein